MQTIQQLDKQNLTQLHLIDENSNLKPGFQQFIKKNDFEKFGKNYNIISIIGSQSTGKSTLLNKLFGTQFLELNSKEKRNQTTKGVWVSKDFQYPFLILDVEGSDSSVRWDEHFFEQSTALLALAISQILIINIWTSDVGRFSGSQYGILKVIFEMNIKLFGQDQTKQIVFVLRDYSNEENFEEITKLILGDINKIWNEIKKPNEFQNRQVDYFFKIDFFTLSHIKYAKDDFEKEVKCLRTRFTEKQDSHYLFKFFDYNSNLPVDGLDTYVNTLWETIKSNKDLNLPSQKIMVANMRCDQIIAESNDLIQIPMQNLKKTTNLKEINQKFGEDGQQILVECVQYFDKNASDYIQQVYEEKRQQLFLQILNELYNLFQAQIMKIKKKLLNDYINHLKVLEKQQITLPQKIEEIKKAFSQIWEQFEYLCNVSQIQQDKPWDLTVDFADFQFSLMQQQQQYQEKIIESYLFEKERTVKRELEKVVNLCFENLDSKNFWSQIQNVYNNQVIQARNEIIQNFESLKFDEDAQFKQTQSFQEEIYKQLVLELQKKTEQSNILYYLLKWFKVKFERNEKGIPKDWRKMLKDQIENQFIECRKKLLELIEIFKYLRVTSNPEQTLMIDCSDSIGGFEEILIEDLTFQQIKNKLQEETDYILADAIAKQESKPQSGIPKWLWFVLIFFMYDDILRWMGSWYLFYPLLLTLALIGFSFAIGQGQFPKLIVKEIYKVLKSLLGEHVTKAALKLGLG